MPAAPEIRTPAPARPLPLWPGAVHPRWCRSRRPGRGVPPAGTDRAPAPVDRSGPAMTRGWQGRASCRGPSAVRRSPGTAPVSHRTTSDGTRWWSMSTSACLMSWDPDTRSAPSTMSTATGGGPTSAIEQRLEVEVAGELFVDSPLGVPAVDQPVGQVSPGLALQLHRRTGVAESAPRRRFQRAMTLVKALSFTTGWYSSGPITAVEVTAAVVVGPHPAGPVAGRVHHQVPAGSGREGGVACPRRVVRRGPGDVGHDVLFVRTRWRSGRFRRCVPGPTPASRHFRRRPTPRESGRRTCRGPAPQPGLRGDAGCDIPAWPGPPPVGWRPEPAGRRRLHPKRRDPHRRFR